MSLNVKKIKKIRRFGRMRFKGDVRYNPKVLLNIYERASDKKRKMLDAEMDNYFHHIKEGSLSEGDSVLKLALDPLNTGLGD